MSSADKVIKMINDSQYSICDIADKLGITVDEFELKLKNNLDFFPTEILKLSEILDIKEPYNFFYD